MKRWIAAWTICAAVCAHAQNKNLKVAEMNGHTSPVAIKVTYPNNRSRNLMLVGIGSSIRDLYLTHQLVVRADGGASLRSLWLDTIAAIHGTSTMRTLGAEFTINLKDGKQIAAMFSAFHDVAATGSCNGEPSDEGFTCNILYVHNEDDSTEKIDLRKVQDVEFLAPARRDKSGNAMFDLWHYSPFTGEKLP